MRNGGFPYNKLGAIFGHCKLHWSSGEVAVGNIRLGE